MAERTDEEIIQRIHQLNGQDFFGFESSDLICRLPFEKAKEFLSPAEDGDNAEDCWVQVPRDRESVLEEMHDYMEFAWGKANDMRGLSASRSMSHYSAWTWLIGEDFGDLKSYEFYGKPHLVAICKRFGWDHLQWDDGVRTNG